MIHFTNINGERLPEDVNKIANRYYDGEMKPDSNNEMKVKNGFYYSATKEGRDIWDEVHEGNYEPLRKFHNL